MASRGRPITGRNTDRVTVSIQKDVLKTTKDLAKNEGVTVSAYVTMVLAKHIDGIEES